ncbi:MAG: hypothetical protein ACRDL4_21295, partial [Thermoleophilaceae bacterium]
MSSRPAVSPLNAAEEAEIARALANGPGREAAFQALVTTGRRRLCVSAARPENAHGSWERYSAVVRRRAEATGYRLLPVAATGDFDGCHWIAYEVGSMRSLAAERRRPWAVEPCLDLVVDLAQALDQAAEDDLLPYELTPASIFVEPRLGVLLGDFGSAREAFGGATARAGWEVAYVPPEVRRGESAEDRSGVFVCGALLHELLTGRPPGLDPVSRWRTDVSDAIDVVVARATARDSLERYESATELCARARRALLGDLSDPPPAAAPASLPAPATDPEPSQAGPSGPG